MLLYLLSSTLLWPLLVYTLGVLFLAVFMLVLSHFLGERHHERATNETYESGIKTTGTARLRFSSHFYLVAMFFVIFDLEAAFIIAWAIAFDDLGWAGFWGILVFIGILFIVLFYEWKTGALDFGPNARKILKGYWQKKSS